MGNLVLFFLLSATQVYANDPVFCNWSQDVLADDQAQYTELKKTCDNLKNQPNSQRYYNHYQHIARMHEDHYLNVSKICNDSCDDKSVCNGAPLEGACK